MSGVSSPIAASPTASSPVAAHRTPLWIWLGLGGMVLLGIFTIPTGIQGLQGNVAPTHVKCERASGKCSVSGRLRDRVVDIADIDDVNVDAQRHYDGMGALQHRYDRLELKMKSGSVVAISKWSAEESTKAQYDHAAEQFRDFFKGTAPTLEVEYTERLTKQGYVELIFWPIAGLFVFGVIFWLNRRQ
jgi:hypothetical protein